MVPPFLSLSLSLSLSHSLSLFSPSLFLTRVVKELLNKDVETAIDVDEDGNTPLHLACISGSYKVAKVIIENKAADVEARWVNLLHSSYNVSICVQKSLNLLHLV